MLTSLSVVGIIPTMSFIRKRKRNGKVYLEEVESVRIDGKVVQKHIRYIGREADNKTVLSASISDITIESVKVHGPLLVLNQISKEINLSKLLGVHGDEILSLVYAHCMDYKSVSQMSQWFEKTDLNMILDIDNLTEDRLLKALDSIELCDIEALQKNIFENVKLKYNLDTHGVIYDVTNTYLCGKKCDFGKLGKDKEGVKGRPLIQIGLGVTQKDGIPILHKTFNGNISDSRTLHDLITSFSHYKISEGMIIYDRGITSSSNIKAINKLKWDTICGVALNNKLKIITRNIISQGKLTEIKKRVKINKTVFYAFPQEYFFGDVKGKLVICYNEQKEKDLRESRYDEILNAQICLKNGQKIKEGLSKYFYTNNSLNHTAISKAEEFDGFSFVFSTKKLSASEILKLYFQDKDIVEKAFQSIKGVVRLRPIRHWLYNRVTAHIFICYLSYLLLSILRLKLKRTGISPVSALRELDTLYKVYVKDSKKGFQLSRTVALTKLQEKILKSVDSKLLSECSG